MKKICPSKVFAFACVFAAIFSLVVAELLSIHGAEAASEDHPAVLLRISTYDKGAIIYMQPNKTVIGSYGANSLYLYITCTFRPIMRHMVLDMI